MPSVYGIGAPLGDAAGRGKRALKGV